LAELRSYGMTANNDTVTLSATDGDPHPVTGVVTPGEYWINGDHIANPTQSMPIFMELSGTGNTYDLSGATINLDTRKLDGFGRALGHDSGVDVIRISGSNNTVLGINLIGQDIALDTDPNAQRYADWATQYIELSGDSNMVDGANVVTRGSRTDTYGLGDAFGKGASMGVTPFIGHRKASAFRVGDATDAVVNDMHLQVNTFGHGFFVQTSTNTTLTNSTVTGELFPSTNVINHPLYQQYGYTYWGNPIPDDIMISGAEGGVRMYTGSSGLTVDNVVVTNMRSGFATSLGAGTKTLTNVEAYGTEAAFGVGNNTTIIGAKADGVNGPLVIVDRDIRHSSSVEIELVGNQPFNHDYALVYVNGNNMDVSITSDRPAEDFQGTTLFRSAQFWYENWRENNGTTTHDVSGYDHVNSEIINDTNMTLILGEQASGTTGRSQGLVITNGENNDYDGISLVPSGKRTVLVHPDGLGNNGTAADGSLETNASIVADGGTLEIQPGIQIADEKLTITGDGVDGNGALYSDGSVNSGTRFGSSNNGDESTIFLDGDASIGVGVAGNQLLAGRIQGTGDLTKLGDGKLVIGKSSTFDGNLIVAEGHVTGRPGVVHRDLTVAAGASISGIGNNAFNTQGDVSLDGQLDLNDRTDGNTLSGKIGRLFGTGQVVSSNPFAGSAANLEIAFGSGEADFLGDISTAVSLTKSGAGTQILSGINAYTGTTTVNGGMLQVDGTHTGGGQYTVGSGGTLGGNGSVDSAVMVNSGGHLSPGASAGSITVTDVSWSSGAFFDVELAGTTPESEYDQLITDSAALGGLLTISLLESAGVTYLPLPTDTYTILASNTNLSGAFGNVASGQRLETLGGEGTFLVTYQLPGEGGPSNTVVLSDFQASALDYGDAPATYATLLGNDGARHAPVGPQLGPSRDTEGNGVPSVAADGDGSDEDGVLFGAIGVDQSLAAVNIDLENAIEARVDAWIDFDRDGVWSPAEKILDSVVVDQPFQTFNYNLPAGLTQGDLFARVRLSTDGGLEPSGFARDGEVEDYLINAAPAAPLVESIVINDGEATRSKVTSVTVKFDSEVDHAALQSAFVVTNITTSTEIGTVNVVATDGGGMTTAVLTFEGASTIAPELETLRTTLDNGNYRLDVLASQVVLASHSTTTMVLDHLFGGQLHGQPDNDDFFRWYGDHDGDGLTNFSDFASGFLPAFASGLGDAAYDESLDSDGDGYVNFSDFAGGFLPAFSTTRP
tara:strand:+ start:150060 stop:153770 length:3711 start_codon:yes stop_codon:yes gene_type:complete